MNNLPPSDFAHTGQGLDGWSRQDNPMWNPPPPPTLQPTPKITGAKKWPYVLIGAVATVLIAALVFTSFRLLTTGKETPPSPRIPAEELTLTPEGSVLELNETMVGVDSIDGGITTYRILGAERIQSFGDESTRGPIYPDPGFEFLAFHLEVYCAFGSCNSALNSWYSLPSPDADQIEDQYPSIPLTSDNRFPEIRSYHDFREGETRTGWAFVQAKPGEDAYIHLGALSPFFGRDWTKYPMFHIPA